MKKTIATLSLMALMLGTTTAFAAVTKQDNKPATTNTATHTTKGKRKGKAKTAKHKPAATTTKPSGK